MDDICLRAFRARTAPEACLLANPSLIYLSIRLQPPPVLTPLEKARIEAENREYERMISDVPMVSILLSVVTMFILS